MVYLTYTALIILGIVFGALAAWAAHRFRWAAELAVLTERLEGKERSLEESRIENQRLNAVLERLRESLAEESEKKVSAEALNERIPTLEKERQQALEEIRQLQSQGGELREKLSRIETRREEELSAAEEKIRLLSDAQAKLQDAFKALSAEALKDNNQSFLELARATLEKFQESAKGELDKKQQSIAEMVKPVHQSLEKFDDRVRELETVRVGAYESLHQQVQSLVDTQLQLRSETSNLVRALRSPVVRGRWGEIQLKRVVEMAGMLDHCDFYEQESVTTENGRLRADLIVKLPGGKNIVVDSKAPLTAYLEAHEASDDEVRQEKMKGHARQIRNHLSALSRKSYWDQFQPAPEFVILFLPGENFFSAALEQDPRLIESGVEQRVLIATPTTLITLLRTVAYGWRQEALAENAQRISDLGRELYKRLADMTGHWLSVGKNLDRAVRSYNRAVGSLESRVLVSARRFKELEAAPAQTEVAELKPVERSVRSIESEELLPGDTSEEAAVSEVTH